MGRGKLILPASVQQKLMEGEPDTIERLRQEVVNGNPDTIMRLQSLCPKIVAKYGLMDGSSRTLSSVVCNTNPSEGTRKCAPAPIATGNIIDSTGELWETVESD